MKQPPILQPSSLPTRMTRSLFCQYTYPSDARQRDKQKTPSNSGESVLLERSAVENLNVSALYAILLGIFIQFHLEDPVKLHNPQHPPQVGVGVTQNDLDVLR